MTIAPVIATQDTTCLRCVSLGIETPTIIAGFECMKFEGNDCVSYSCMDCFNRLREEIAGIDSDAEQE